MKQKVLRYPRLVAELKAVEEQLYQVLQQDLAPGTPVEWIRGQHAQLGTVVEVTGPVGSPSIRVRNDRTGKLYSIPLVQISRVYAKP